MDEITTYDLSSRVTVLRSELILLRKLKRLCDAYMVFTEPVYLGPINRTLVKLHELEQLRQGKRES